MENITQLIGSVGFPIVMALLMWYDKVTTLKENAKALNELSKAIEQNTIVTQSLHQSIMERKE